MIQNLPQDATSPLVATSAKTNAMPNAMPNATPTAGPNPGNNFVDDNFVGAGNVAVPALASLARRRFMAAGAIGALGAMFANVGPAFAATKKKKVVVKAPVKKATSAVTKLAPVPTVAPTTGGTTAAATAHSGAFSDLQELAISFSFVRTASGGRAHDPYVAVWIEDANEALVRTVSLNYQQGRGERWLNDLRRWYSAYTQNAAALGADRVQEVTGPTRIPGVYSLVWDGLSEAKAAIPHGNYFVCIEAAVEKGSYQLLREPVQITGAPFSKAAADKGDLQKVKLELRAK
jgi:hypothetical protein